MKVTYPRYTLYVLLLNIVVILWGGYVSASGSGDGCGTSWPLCADAAERTASGFETFVELFHRATSGLALIAVAVMLVWTLRRFPRGHHARFAAWGSAIFILGEAAIGAFIVIASLVADNMNLARAFTQPLHLVNTYLLLGFLGLMVYYAYGNDKVVLASNRPLARQFMMALFGVLFLSAFGTIAALASTIFPSETFIDGVMSDFSAESHYLIRLRILHPILATLVGVYLVWLMRKVEGAWGKGHGEGWMAYLPQLVLALFAIQYALGALTAVLLAPIAMSLLHLLISDLIWLGILWVGARALSEQVSGDRIQNPSLRTFASSRLGDASSTD